MGSQVGGSRAGGLEFKGSGVWDSWVCVVVGLGTVGLGVVGLGVVG